MRRQFVWGVSACVSGLLTAGLALAEQAPSGSALLVRAWGHEGAVERVRERDAHGTIPADAEFVIPRSRLQAELDRGIGRFLGNVRTQAVLSHGHFVGWRLLTLFPDRPDVQVQGLRRGDVVLRVNGASIERPGVFKLVWDSLSTAEAITIEIERDGQLQVLRYKIR